MCSESAHPPPGSPGHERPQGRGLIGMDAEALVTPVPKDACSFSDLPCHTTGEISVIRIIRISRVSLSY